MSEDVEQIEAHETPERGWDDFAPLYDEHHERLYRIALLLCHGSQPMAEDAVAETFLRVYPAWVEGRVEHFFAYARQTLVNHVMGQYRNEQVASRYAGTQRGDGRGGERLLDDSIADASTTFQLLAQLAPRQRMAVVLRYFEDLSYEQIAALMGVSVGTAKAQVSTGLQRMRDLMREEGRT
jgi:RNA polymerase sigma factor (sigma-70 family)